MLLKKLVGLTLGLGLSVALVGCGEDEENTDPGPVLLTVHVVEHADVEVVTDVGAMGDSVGDLLTFTNPVFDSTNKTQVGTDQGYCVRVEAGKSWECEWTLFLTGRGQISVTGPFFDTTESTLTVTGGTGEFKNARGEMKLGFRPDVPAPKVEYDFIYDLIIGP